MAAQPPYPAYRQQLANRNRREDGTEDNRA